MQNVNPTGETFPQRGTAPGSSTGPNDGQDFVQASTIIPGTQDMVNGLSYFAALALGMNRAPLQNQPPVISPDGTGTASGVNRIQRIVLGPTRLRQTPGSIGDVANCEKYGLYSLVGPTGTPDDGLLYLDLADAEIPNWANVTRYAVGALVFNDSGKHYVCVQTGISAAGPATGPSGTGSNIVDGTCKWTYLSGRPQWVYGLLTMMGHANGLATLDGGSLLPTAQLPNIPIGNLPTTGTSPVTVAGVDIAGKVAESVLPGYVTESCIGFSRAGTLNYNVSDTYCTPITDTVNFQPFTDGTTDPVVTMAAKVGDIVQVEASFYMNSTTVGGGSSIGVDASMMKLAWDSGGSPTDISGTIYYASVGSYVQFVRVVMVGAFTAPANGTYHIRPYGRLGSAFGTSLTLMNAAAITTRLMRHT